MSAETTIQDRLSSDDSADSRRSADDIQSRLSRARNEEMEATIVETDPLVVIEVENHDSSDGEDSIYTVIPETGYCGCWDARARNVVCKHVLFLALQDSQVGTHVRDSLEARHRKLSEQHDEVADRLREIGSELATVDNALCAVEDDEEETSTMGRIFERVRS